VSNSDGSSGSGVSGATIGGTVGGVVLFLLLDVLCIVVLLVRRSCRAHDYSIKMNKVNDKPTTAAFTVPNPVYYTTLMSVCTIKKDGQIPHTHDGVKMEESNALHGTTSDVIIQPNPSCGVTKATRKTNEDCLQILHDSPVHCHTEDDNVKMEDDPSYGISTSSTNSDVVIQPNPSYGATKPTRMTSKDQYDYVHLNKLVYNQPVQHHTGGNSVRTEDDPSYGLNRKEYSTTHQDIGADVQIIPNPAYYSVIASHQKKDMKATENSAVHQ